ncbi:MAG: hypothetical protein HZB53_17125 [Chloroflexi bacterium]|nr:hypothetical protein [Chloroflexota bacterium]
MQIIVCIKQVPSMEQIKFDHATRRVVREGVPGNLNTFDRRAITEAIKVRDQVGGQVITVTMGPPQARAVLSESLMMGADRAVHLLGKEFAGADTLATARALADACRKIGYDIVFCGRYAMDSETAQVPPMLAEFLDAPQITGVRELRVSAGSKTITAVRELDEGFETLECELPVVLSASEQLNKPIRVGPADAPKAEGKPIDVWSAADLGGDLAQYGLPGSPTWVEAIYEDAPKRKQIMLNSGDLKQDVRQLVARLREAGWQGSEWKVSGGHSHTRARAADRKPFQRGAKAVWVVAEALGDTAPDPHVHTQQHLRDVTRELMGAGITLANQLDGELAAVVLGYKPHPLVNALAELGADKVYVADAPMLRQYHTEAFTLVLAAAIQDYKPYAVLFGATANGRDLAPRVAARLGLGLTGDAVGMQVDAEGRLVMLKPAFGGNIIAPILSRTTPVLATVRPGMFAPAVPEPGRNTILMRLPSYPFTPRVRSLKHELVSPEVLQLDNAEVIVGIGYGVGGPEGVARVHDFAQRIGATVAGTRKVTDAGWLAPQAQVGISGRPIAPHLYLTLAVSGAFYHTVGIQRAGTIVAVNSSAEAAIFKQSDYGIVADWQAFIATMDEVLAE